ncbi:MAG: hypothetical protein WCH40_13110, partial [Verrucomicrobiales bacterium]
MPHYRRSLGSLAAIVLVVGLGVFYPRHERLPECLQRVSSARVVGETSKATSKVLGGDVRLSARRLETGVGPKSERAQSHESKREATAVRVAPSIENAYPAAVPRPQTFRLPLFYVLDDEMLAAKLPGMTVQGIQVLRQIFEMEAGVDSLRPEDPAYAENWQKAELGLQQKMRLWYGWSAWAAYE